MHIAPSGPPRSEESNRTDKHNSGDRQNRRLRSLEAIVESREVALDESVVREKNYSGIDHGLAGPEHIATSSVDLISSHAKVTAQSQLRIFRPAGTDRRSPNSSSISIPTPSSIADQEVLSRLLQDDGNLDEATRLSIISGALTIQHDLKAGIDALLRRSTSPESPSPTGLTSFSPRSPGHGPFPRPDQIFIIENRMQEHAHRPPNPCANGIRIKQLCCVTAARCNAEILGITFEQLSNNNGVSPFYDPSVTKGTEEAICAERFQHVSPDLRPTAAQIRYPHHPWIDTIPAPTLRQRLLEAISMDPPMIDWDEFCDDLENDGIVCWGSTPENADLHSGSGAPWDVRSWEAQPWFLRKWWFYSVVTTESCSKQANGGTK